MALKDTVYWGRVVKVDEATGALAVYGVNGGGASGLNVTLQSAATAVGNGTTVDLTGQSQTTLSVEGTATSFTVVAEGSVDGVNFYALEVVQRGSLAITQSITAKGIYVVDLTGLSKLRARIQAVSGGNVTVLAR